MSREVTVRQAQATDRDEAALSDEEHAALLDASSEQFARVRLLAEELGLKPAVVSRLVRRMRAKYQPITGELRQHKTSEILAMIEDRVGRALGYLDDQVLSEAKAKDLAITLGILLEKRQLLRGEPTQILSVEERQGLNELLPRLIAEAKRRGLAIDVYGGEAVVAPPEPERVARPRTGRLTFEQLSARTQHDQAEAIGEPG